MPKRFDKRWLSVGALLIFSATVFGTFAYIARRGPAPAEVAAPRPHESIVSRLAEQQALDFSPTGGDLLLDRSQSVLPQISSTTLQSLPADESLAGVDFFGPRSLAIVPEEWPRARMKFVIGATAMVHEAQSDLAFQARVDTGAHTCSLHVEEFVVRDAAEAMEENIGKEIRFKVTNHEGTSEWLESIIDCCASVRTSDHVEERYKVPIAFRWNDFERMVLVTLNNRGKMTYPLLLGRNFLQSDFVVDVALDGDR